MRNRLLADVLERTQAAPFYTPVMPKTGAPLSVSMTNFGALGWMSNTAGYRYQSQHPETGMPWPDIPPLLLDIWTAATGRDDAPDACLVNYYRAKARMGLHQDRDESDLSAPVVSVSLGDTAVFRLGGSSRKDKTASLRLESGDVLVLDGASRMAFHGVDRILGGSSTLIDGGGRINLTLRKAG